MTPAARLAAAIEVLDQIAASRGAADVTLKAWGKAHRFAGSADRRAIADRVYAVLRARARLSWTMAGEETGRSLVCASLAVLDRLSPLEVTALFDGQGHAPACLSPDELDRLRAPQTAPPAWVQAGVPEFVLQSLEAQFGCDALAEAQTLIGSRAPLDLRVNTLRGNVDRALSLLRTDGVEPQRTPLSALGLRLSAELAADVVRLRAFTSGWVEVQDEASQIAASLAGVHPGMTVVDYCAGGGGKSLAFGARLRGQGRLVASDVSAKRLAAMHTRLQRADVAAEMRQLGPEGRGMEDLESAADVVFVDAPCSGSGTWRRHPEGAWRLRPEAVDRLAGLQQTVLSRAARLVRPGGRLAYATCSVLAQENARVADAFLADDPQFTPLSIVSAASTPELSDDARVRLAELVGEDHRLQMTPRRTGTDGFFIALFERRAPCSKARLSPKQP